MHLAFDDHRIDQRAEVVDAGIFDHFDKAGVGIDLDFRDMAAIRIGGGAGAVADMRDIERLRQIGQQLGPAMKFLCQLHNRNGAIRSDDNEASMFEGDVGRCRLKHMRGELLAIRDDLRRALHDRGAAMHQRLRPAGTAADHNAIAVALHEFDLFDRNAELVAQDLREWRRMAHAEIERAGRERYRAVGIKRDFRKLLHGRGGDFEIIGNT